MLKSVAKSFFLSLLLGAFALLANAQSAAPKAAVKASPVEAKLVRSKIVMVDGKETLQDAAVAKPGDVLQEVATYTNKSTGTISKLEATLPIPKNTELVAGSVSPNTAMASTDGVNFSAMPLKRKIKGANGVEVEQPVALSAYRALRWYPGDLGAGKSLAFSARFKVADDKPVAASSAVKSEAKK